MHSFAIIRALSTQEMSKVHAAARRFCDKYGIHCSEDDLINVEFSLYNAYPEDKARLRKIWAGYLARAVGSASQSVRMYVHGDNLCLECE